MKRYITLTVILFVCYVLQSAVFSFLPLGSVTPDLMICVVVSFALLDGSKEGLWLGFSAGLILDIFFGYHLGMYALIYMYVGYMNGIFRHFGYAEELKFPIMMVAISEFSVNLLNYFIMFYLRGRTDFFYYLKTIILPKTAYTTLVSVFLSFIFLVIHQLLEKTIERGSRELDL